jgi:quinol monooxygenase YgiN
MTFADAGTLDAVPGRRDEPVRHLTRRSDCLAELGCLLHEVGTNDAEPDRVFLIELWRDAAAHRASLAEPDVQASIAAARPLLAGTFGGFRFDVVGPPLRDWPPPPGTPRPLRAAGACGTEREEGGSGGVRAGIEVLEQGRPGRVRSSSRRVSALDAGMSIPQKPPRSAPGSRRARSVPCPRSNGRCSSGCRRSCPCRSGHDRRLIET